MHTDPMPLHSLDKPAEACANSAQPTHFWVTWEQDEGDILRTIYRWEKAAAEKLSRVLLELGAKRVWLMKSNEAPPWNEKELHKGIEVPRFSYSLILPALRRVELGRIG